MKLRTGGGAVTEAPRAAAPILVQPLAVTLGRAIAPDRPGAGLEWNEGAIRRLQIE